MKPSIKNLSLIFMFSSVLAIAGGARLANANSENFQPPEARQDNQCENAMDTAGEKSSVRRYMNAVKKLKPPRRGELTALAQPDGPTSVAIRNRIALGHLRFVVWQAYRLARRLGNFQLVPDLIGEGNLGLTEASRDADESILAHPGVRFLNYAAPYIDGYMMRYVRTHYRFPKSSINSNGKRFRARAELRMLLILDDSAKKVSLIADPLGEPISSNSLVSSNQEAGFQLQNQFPGVFGSSEIRISGLLPSASKVEDLYIRAQLLEIIRANFEAFLETLSLRQREIFQIRFGSPDEEKLSMEKIGQSLTPRISDFTVGKEIKAIENKLREFFIPLIEAVPADASPKDLPPPNAAFQRSEISDATVVHDILGNSQVSGIVNGLIPLFLVSLNDVSLNGPIDRRVFVARTSSPRVPFAQLSKEVQRTLSQLAKIEARVFRSFVVFIAPHLSEHRNVIGDHFFHAADEFQRRMQVNDRVNNAKTAADYLEGLLQRPELLEIIMARFTTYFENHLKDDDQRRIFSNRLQSQPLSLAAMARELGVSRQSVAERENRIIKNFLKFMQPFWPTDFIPEDLNSF